MEPSLISDALAAAIDEALARLDEQDALLNRREAAIDQTVIHPSYQAAVRVAEEARDRWQHLWHSQIGPALISGGVHPARKEKIWRGILRELDQDVGYAKNDMEGR